MAFDSKPTISLTLDQVISLVEQLSPKDRLKVARAIRTEQRIADIERMAEIMGKVKMKKAELDHIIEQERE